MKKLIIADLKSFNNCNIQTGHYFALARNFKELFSSICQVRIAGGPIYSKNFKEEELLPLPYDFIVGNNVLKNKWSTLMNCYHLMRQTQTNDIIVLQMSGAVTNFLALILFGSKKKKIYSIQYDTETLNTPIKKLIYWLAKSKITGIICPSDIIGEAFHLPYCVVSDYIYASNPDKIEFIPFTEKKYDFAIVGRITPEKGIIEALKRLATTPYRTIVAGKPQNKEIEKQLQKFAASNPNIELHLGFVSDNDFYHYLRQSKYSLMNYQGVYGNRSSGVVLDTLFNGTPVIGHRSLALQFIEKEEVGILYDDITQMDLSIVEDSQQHFFYTKHISRYLQKHKQYKDKLVRFLQLRNSSQHEK